MSFKSMSAESDFELAKLTLEQKLNIEDGGDVDVAVDILPKIVDKDMETCISFAMRQRPDLKVSELTLKSAEYGEKAEQAKEMPRVDLAGHYKKSAEVYKQGYGGSVEQKLDPQRKWYAGLEVAWPILGSTSSYSLYKREDPSTLSTFTAGTTGTESKGTSWKLDILDDLEQFSVTKEAEISRIRAEEDLNETRKKVIMEVKEAYYGYEKARIQMEATDLQREFHEKEVEILKAKHSMGDSELSELFQGFSRLLEASGQYFEAEKNLYTAIAALNRAIGLDGYF